MSLGKVEVFGLIVLFIMLLFTGSKKLPEMARGIGESVKELKRGFETDGTDKDDTELSELGKTGG